MTSLRPRIDKVRLAGDARRDLWEPPAWTRSMYEWWRANARKPLPRESENLCHFFWTPLRVVWVWLAIQARWLGARAGGRPAVVAKWLGTPFRRFAKSRVAMKVGGYIRNNAGRSWAIAFVVMCVSLAIAIGATTDWLQALVFLGLLALVLAASFGIYQLLSWWMRISAPRRSVKRLAKFDADARHYFEEGFRQLYGKLTSLGIENLPTYDEWCRQIIEAMARRDGFALSHLRVRGVLGPVFFAGVIQNWAFDNLDTLAVYDAGMYYNDATEVLEASRDTVLRREASSSRMQRFLAGLGEALQLVWAFIVAKKKRICPLIDVGQAPRG